MNRFRFDAVATYVIAVLAFALSYSNLADLAARAGYGTYMAHAWPLVVDGLAQVTSLGMLVAGIIYPKHEWVLPYARLELAPLVSTEAALLGARGSF